MIPASQIIATSRYAFALTVLGAMTGATLLLCSAMWEEPTLERAAVQIVQVFIGIVPSALVGAAAGGMLALMFGANLSRQYCWLFALTSGLLGLPLMAYSLSQLRFALDTDRWMPKRFQAIEWEMIASLAPLLVGLLLAFLTTRTRVGFTQRSRRAAWIAAPIGLAMFGLVQLAYWWGMKQRHINMNEIGASSWFWLYVTFAGFFTLCSAGIAAAWFADRPRETRWEVVPVAQAST